MKTYSSGNNRVHASSSLEQINAAIAEYEAYAQKHPNQKLSLDLLECAADLREELELRNQSGSTATDLLIVTVGILSIGALAFTIGAIPVLIGFAELAKILAFNF